MYHLISFEKTLVSPKTRAEYLPPGFFSLQNLSNRAPYFKALLLLKKNLQLINVIPNLKTIELEANILLWVPYTFRSPFWIRVVQKYLMQTIFTGEFKFLTPTTPIWSVEGLKGCWATNYVKKYLRLPQQQQQQHKSAFGQLLSHL